ncbi:MAG TPA: ATP-binding cassette domain-containing protein [Rhodopila sp.]
MRASLLMAMFAHTDRAAVTENLGGGYGAVSADECRFSAGAGALSAAEQQMVAIARALMGRPRLLCMDEPTKELSRLNLELVAMLGASGDNGFMGEHNAGLAPRIARCAGVRQTGRIILPGKATDVARNSRFRDALSGGERDDARRPRLLRLLPRASAYAEALVVSVVLERPRPRRT